MVGNGVIHMGFLNIIRRMSLREKLSIRVIRRRTGLSRNTIAKYLNAGTVEPTFATPDRVSKLDPFAEKLSGWLKAEASKSRKERRTAKPLYADLVTLGFTGSYGRVAAFSRDWRADRQRTSQTTGRGTFVNRPGFTGGQNSRRIARYGTDTKEEDLEAVFTRCLTVH